MNNYQLVGKVAVISGGTSGIGLAVAEKMLCDGSEVFIVGRSEKRGQAALAALNKFASRVTYIQSDVSTLNGCKKVATVLKQNKSKVDILINSAGIYNEQRLELVTEAEYNAVMDTNLKGTFFLCQSIIPLLSEENATIINIASDAALEGNYGCPIYCASKGAVVALTRALALDLAPKVRVNCICPGDVLTPMVQAQVSKGGYTLQEMAEPYPLGRIGRPEEIAHVICSLSSPLNSYMTGAIINVDGGLTAK
ncbi:MAG: SDR family NAD(P)-dependent oxidoreductase [Acidaminococcaceae bacterium]|nr:SDR family NAD(P)-dependent oxidoreductase [Acidaminococcaceae bacterium]MDD4721723.1 SDR family NAD(P)-dependent oxidoreductase [Acidaminococcaceae bacterium]